MKTFLIKTIKAYKKFSHNWVFVPIPFYASSCKYHPSCGDYTIEAIEKYGVFTGTKKSFSRILRCNPFSKGGVDLP